MITTGENGEKITPVRWLRLGQIQLSELQPRKHFDQVGINELVESFRQHGFSPGVSHLLVRPIGEVRINHEPDSAHWFIQRLRIADTGDRKEESQWDTVDTAESELEAQRKLKDAEQFELVCGERRWRASDELKLERVPCVVEEHDDVAVLQLQLVENMQRESLTPMEEALAFKRLNDMGQSQREIAAAIGCHESFVQQRLVLLRLANSPIADAIERNDITVKHGEILSRVPSPALRVELLEKVLMPPDGSSAPWKTEALQEHINIDYIVDLRRAIFDKEDPHLVPVHLDENGKRLWGGACLDCPMNTAADPCPVTEWPHTLASGDKSITINRRREGQKEWYFRFEGEQFSFRRGVDAIASASELLGLLFDAPEPLPPRAAPMCTNPECFREKERADHEEWRCALRGEARGLFHAENAELWNEHGTELHPRSEFVELDSYPEDSELNSVYAKSTTPGVPVNNGGRPTWRLLVRDQSVPITLGRDVKGNVHELVLHEDAKKAAHLNGHLIFRDSKQQQRLDAEPSASAPRPAPPSEEEVAAAVLEDAAHRQSTIEIRNAEIGAIVEAATGCVRRGMIQLPKEFWGAVVLSLLDAVDRAGKLDELADRQEFELDAESVTKMTLGGRLGLAVDCLISLSDGVDVWAKVFGVKLAAVRKKAEKKAAHTKVTKDTTAA